MVYDMDMYQDPQSNTVFGYRDGQCVLKRRRTDDDKTLPHISAAGTTHLAKARYTKEIQGIETPFGAIATDRESQSMIANTLSFLLLQPSSHTIAWKRKDGTFIELSRDQFTELAKLVGDHVETCFHQEAAALEAMLSADDVADIDVTTYFSSNYSTKNSPIP